MIIDKSSWHYRFLIRSKITPSENLCVYFWQIPLSVVFHLILAAIVVVVVVAVTLPLSLLISYMIGQSSADDAMALGILWVIFVAWVFLDKITIAARRLFGRKESAAKTHQPNIAIEYAKAKKAKICPVLEFRD